MKQDLNGVRTPEDVMRRLADNVKITADEVEGLTVEVSKKVGDDEIISKINQSPESITLDANKININGVISANGNFQIDREGNMTCNDATMRNVNIEDGNIDMVSNDEYPKFKIRTSAYENSGVEITGGEINFIDDDGIPILNIFKHWSFGAGDYMCGSISLGNPDDGTDIIYLDGDLGEIICVSLTQTSLEEKKKNFEKLDNALDIVKDTEIYKYHFKNQKETDKKHIGFVIGENYNYRKELTDSDNKGVDLYSMISVLWRAVQEQQVEIEKLKKEVKNDKN